MKPTAHTTSNQHDAEYAAYMDRIQARFLGNLAAGATLYTTGTGTTELFHVYLMSFPEVDRQYHNCNTCRRFFNTFGGLVTIDENGKKASALWSVDDAPAEYKDPIASLIDFIGVAGVTGVFRSSEATWGQPIAGGWQHFAVTPPAAIVHKSRILTPYQASAEKREDRLMLITALKEFDSNTVKQAVTLLKTDSLYRSEKCLGVAEWLAALQLTLENKRGEARDNLLWRAAATAPTGFCHVRSSMIGTLLEDIAAGMSLDNVSRRFADKMHPLRYQRPQAAPAAGNIAQAEKLVEQLGIARSLPRRFARLDEVQALWTPAAKQDDPAPTGVFGHLKPKDARPAPANLVGKVTMTWEKFARTVLPTAEEIEYVVPAGRASYCALVTAVDPAAPPILQWDREDARNPVSWYVYNGGSTPAQWGLTAGTRHPVTAVTLKPSMWNGGFEHQGAGVIFILDGAKDSHEGVSGCLFPEILKSELHSVRATIEAYSRNARLDGADEASAAGIMLAAGQPWNAVFTVRAGGTAVDYHIDRWD